MNATRIAAAALAAATSITVGMTVAAGNDTAAAVRHSCGWHCPAAPGSRVTPAAPPDLHQDRDGDGIIDGSIQQVGRTRAYSGGRLHGSANKRVGCGGCKGNPA